MPLTGNYIESNILFSKLFLTTQLFRAIAILFCKEFWKQVDTYYKCLFIFLDTVEHLDKKIVSAKQANSRSVYSINQYELDRRSQNDITGGIHI